MFTKTPPLGWNSWNTFGPNISEKLIMEITDKMIELGLDKAGYKYIVIDDCYSLRERNAEGDIVINPELFPHGMAYLADYIHSKGLLFGMYSCCGTKTCAGYPSSYHNEFRDAKLFASFKIDFLKYDFCNVPEGEDAASLYRTMGMALKACGRDILFSACNWGACSTEKWIRSTGAGMYRSTGDIVDNFASIRDISKSQLDKLAYSGIGCYNDVDMLVVGMYNKGLVANGGCNADEYRTHFALWCMFGSPLMIGCDIRIIDETSLKLLKNETLLRIDQDEEMRTPFVCADNGSDGIGLFRHLSGDDYALLFVNYADNDASIDLDLKNIGLWSGIGYGLSLKDVFTDEDEGKHFDSINKKLKAHECAMYMCKIVKK